MKKQAFPKELSSLPLHYSFIFMSFAINVFIKTLRS
uniref:Uncharacterized protein n=1 Tax=Arundo donax TaxID=35708 RepID=A0A0A8ZG80_ARUDO